MVKIMIFISDVQNHVPIKLCKAAGGILLFKIISTLDGHKHKTKQKIFMGNIGDRLQRSHSDF